MSSSGTLTILQYQNTTNIGLNDRRKILSSAEFSDWCKTVSFSALDGSKLGQIFCRDFDLQDFLLTHALNSQQAMSYIKKTYVYAINNP